MPGPSPAPPKKEKWGREGGGAEPPRSAAARSVRRCGEAARAGDSAPQPDGPSILSRSSGGSSPGRGESERPWRWIWNHLPTERAVSSRWTGRARSE